MQQPIDSVWTREPRTSRSPTLSRGQIVRAAMELLDAEGVDALSMRRLGAKLGAGATSIYWHVAHKEELLELVMDEVYGEVPLPDPEVVGWEDAVTVFAYGLRDALFKHPWAVSLISTRPALGPNAIRRAALMATTFERAGFTGLEVDYAGAALLSYVLGATAPEIAWQDMTDRSGLDGEELLAAMHETVRRAARDHPDLISRHERYRDHDAAVTRAVSFDFGLTCLLDGLRARLARDAGPRTGSDRESRT
ncbi:TetR/AcrR family transcriptional regulator C-terminal domain-containing protein [Planomonospora parontospora]|uniref:TetR/AcrR family transcriptional regulator C-terminal domain-containing protein n=1 Tax=Planomonospora parontospora TaxID=58119 RepID=UPI0019C8E997|nr:TetR/AcrR family transcriptional regulator C-terminal domain-containing protein [Planomonospora parontospora]GGL21016.1 TetR family transcriptional regulator [Planomonospora parontospora subsp. antibiotica]GII15840.1 TetR family transcriptional regulator [Planomonospora parontospora subsp. antibiotica]